MTSSLRTVLRHRSTKIVFKIWVLDSRGIFPVRAGIPEILEQVFTDDASWFFLVDQDFKHTHVVVT